MKNQNLFILALLLIVFSVQNAHSQVRPETCMDCWHKGGDFVNGPEFIGTVNTQPFSIRTAGMQRLTVDSSGNVYIGVGQPHTLPYREISLQVFGTIAANNIMVTSDNGTKDLLSLITELQKEVAELKQQLAVAEEKQ